MGRNDTLFLAQKLDKQIKMRGSEFTFVHVGEDKYHRKTEPVNILVHGIYHETISYQNKNTKDGSTTHKKASPMILCKMEEGSLVSVEDILEWSSGSYRVTAIEDIQQFGVACQISLEEIVDV